MRKSFSCSSILGLLARDNEVIVGGNKVKVRDVMREQLSPQLRLGR